MKLISGSFYLHLHDRSTLPFHSENKSSLIERFEIVATKTTLGIILDPYTHQLHFTGISYPTNPITFFQPVLDWVERYLTLVSKEAVTIHMHMHYFNTSSSTFLYRIMEYFDAFQKEGGKVRILWHYEDEDDDVLDAWKSLLSDLDLPLEMVKIPAKKA